MRAIVLAAGRGSRLNEATDDKPKCLVKVRGTSLLDLQLAALRAAGLNEIGICTGYRREQLAALGMPEFHNARWAETNMVSSLACAAAWLQDGPCIVSYSDIFYDSSAVSALMASDADIAITYDVNWRALWEERFDNPLDDAESFRLHADGTLAEIGNRATSMDAIEGQYMGVLRFTPAGWAEVMRIRAGLSQAEQDRMHMTGTLQKILEAGRMPVHAVPYAGTWGEVDSLEDLAVYS